MRADAQRNAEKLRAAASELFQARGLQVPLREIAREAGVSHGTLFNLFGSREQLIDDVVADIAAGRIAALGDRALANPDPWSGFVDYVHDLCAIQAEEPMMADVLSGRYPDARQLMEVCRRTVVTAGAIIERAQHSGELRSDFTGEDLALTFGPSPSSQWPGGSPPRMPGSGVCASSSTGCEPRRRIAHSTRCR